MSWNREEPARAGEPGQRKQGYRRLVCDCGCGLWWYWLRQRGRPPAYVSPEHYQRARNRRRRVHPLTPQG